MARFDASQVDCFVLTFKEGLLSKVAHDLKLRVAELAFTVDPETRAVEATFDPARIFVECSMKDGREDWEALSRSDREKIEKAMRDDVLHVGRFPEIRFRSTETLARGDDGYSILGELTLHGATRTVRAEARRVDGAWQTEVTLHQPDFGITPYRAALGALRVQPDVRVRVKVPDPS